MEQTLFEKFDKIVCPINIAKTPTDLESVGVNYLFPAEQFLLVGETCGLPRANTVRPYGVGDTLVPPFLFMNFSAGSSPHTSIGASICKGPRRPIYFLPFLWYNTTNR